MEWEEWEEPRTATSTFTQLLSSLWVQNFSPVMTAAAAEPLTKSPRAKRVSLATGDQKYIKSDLASNVSLAGTATSIISVATKACLWRQNFCHDKYLSR